MTWSWVNQSPCQIFHDLKHSLGLRKWSVVLVSIFLFVSTLNITHTKRILTFPTVRWSRHVNHCAQTTLPYSETYKKLYVFGSSCIQWFTSTQWAIMGSLPCSKTLKNVTRTARGTTDTVVSSCHTSSDDEIKTVFLFILNVYLN